MGATCHHCRLSPNNSGNTPCICLEEDPEPCIFCGNNPCVCDEKRKSIIRIKLADGKTRELNHMVNTSFWSPDGRPISATEFLHNMFGALPKLFTNETELRAIWSQPGTRKKLLEELQEQGFAREQLAEFQKVLRAENSDLYDVLAYVAFESSIINRTERASFVKSHFEDYDPKQQEFLIFVLRQYVQSGVHELDEEKLTPLLNLKYKNIYDAKRELGDVASIRKTFIGFQGYLYGERVR